MRNTEEMKQFRDRLYSIFPRRADAIMDLVDALCANTSARSVVELSLSPLFRRGHASVHDAVEEVFRPKRVVLADAERGRLERDWRRVVAPHLPAPRQRPFWLLAVDTLPLARPHAETLSDRAFVHQAQAVPGRKPVTVGHEYSLVVGLPERSAPREPRWSVPLSARRVPTDKDITAVTTAQVLAIIADHDLPSYEQLIALVADSRYSIAPLLARLAEVEELVVISRLRRNRVFFAPPDPARSPRRGRRPWYGDRFDLRRPYTWGPPHETIRLDETLPNGRTATVELQVWHDRLMRGRRDAPMHRYSMTVLRVRRLDERGRQLDTAPMWLGITGTRRAEVTPVDGYHAFRQRFDQEHLHRFARQHLLFDAFATPDTAHEENWVTLVALAAGQLFAFRRLARNVPRPWERQTTAPEGAVASPSMVQRDFTRISALLGTPARPPKRRGKSPGRPAGHHPRRRKRFAIVRKSHPAPYVPP